MRGFLNLLLICFLLSLVVCAQESPESTVDASGPQDQQQCFVVELTEIEDWTHHDPERDLDAQQLLRESRRNGSDRTRSTVRISAVEGNESYAQFGRQIPVVVGRTTSKGKTEIDYEDENIGTEIRVTVSRFDESRFRVELSFASSELNLRPDGTRDNVEVITATATHTVEPGIPVVVDGSEQHTRVFRGRDSEILPRKSSVLLLSVEAAEQNNAVN